MHLVYILIWFACSSEASILPRCARGPNHYATEVAFLQGCYSLYRRLDVFHLERRSHGSRRHCSYWWLLSASFHDWFELLETKYVATKTIQYRHDICSLQLGERAYITTGCGKKRKNMFRKFPKNHILKFVVMQCAAGGTIENFWYRCTTALPSSV